MHGRRKHGRAARLAAPHLSCAPVIESHKIVPADRQQGAAVDALNGEGCPDAVDFPKVFEKLDGGA